MGSNGIESVSGVTRINDSLHINNNSARSGASDKYNSILNPALKVELKGSNMSVYALTGTYAGAQVPNYSLAISNGGGGPLTLNPDQGGSIGIGTADPKYGVDINRPEVAIRNTNAQAFSSVRLFNDSSATTSATMFLNASARTTDGGANALTLRNNLGDLRLQSKGGSGITISQDTGSINVDKDLQVQGGFNASTANATLYGVTLSPGGGIFSTNGTTGNIPVKANMSLDAGMNLNLGNWSLYQNNSGNLCFNNGTQNVFCIKPDATVTRP